MRTWTLCQGDPLCLTLSADARLCKPDYVDDHNWGIHVGDAEPAALTLETTFGLRANWMRLFPRFTTTDGSRSDPKEFDYPPCLTSCFPNYLAFTYRPFSEFQILSEYWVPEPKVIAGRLRISNLSISTRTLRLDLAALLNPLGTGESMTAMMIGTQQVLFGRAGNLTPLFFLSGNPLPEQNPYPSLSHTVELLPGNSRQFTWVLAALKETGGSFDLAKRTMARSWDGEISRMELFNTAQSLEIFTGYPDWDAALALTQNTAFSLAMQSKYDPSYPGFVISRRPDQGYSLRGDGSDYPYQWNGQMPLDLYYLTSLILPGGVDLAENLLRNMLGSYSIHNEIHPSDKAYRNPPMGLMPPLLASVAWQIDRCKNNSNWLTEIYPCLIDGLKAWFESAQDKDGDQFPEWSHPLQTGMPGCPIFDEWHPDSQGVDIKTLESPALAAFLYKECQSLIQISKKIQQEAEIPWLSKTADAIKQELQSCWDSSKAIFHYRDFQSHQSHAGENLLDFRGPGKFSCRFKSKQAKRLMVHLYHEDETTIPVFITIKGQNESGALEEKLTARSFTWLHKHACFTSHNLFSGVTTIEVQGIKENIAGRISTVDYLSEDSSLLLPLWGGLCQPEQASAMVTNTLLNRYLHPFGIPLSPTTDASSSDHRNLVHMGWNHLFGEALVSLDYRTEAAELVTRLMNLIAASLKRDKGFSESYNAVTGKPFGDRNSLHGLAPLGLFIQTLGIDQITSNSVTLLSSNPFPLPVTVKFRGITITRHQKDSVITFPKGQTISLRDPGPHYVTI